MAKIPRIAVVGSANIDLTTFTDRFPKPGETIFGQKFDLGFGGKGANQATAARLCGAIGLHGGAGRQRSVRSGHHREFQEARHRRHPREAGGRRVQRCGADLCRAQRTKPHLRGQRRERRIETGRRRCCRRPAEGRRLHRAPVRNSARDGLLHHRLCAEERNSLHPESRPRPADRFQGG